MLLEISDGAINIDKYLFKWITKKDTLKYFSGTLI